MRGHTLFDCLWSEFIAGFGCASVEADAVKERPVALLLKLLKELIDFILHVVSVLDLQRRRKHITHSLHAHTAHYRQGT